MSRPLRVRLPGGRLAVLAPIPPSAPPEGAVWSTEIIEALERSELVIDGRALDREGILDLPLPAFHSLRFFVERLVPEREPEEYPCGNCKKRMRVDPLTLVPVEHFQERLGAEPVEPEREFELPEPIETRSGAADTLTMRTVTVREAQPLWAAISGPRPGGITAAVVRAMGVVALGSEHSPEWIARALARAPDTAWNDVAWAFDEMAYPEGLVAPAFCEACGARGDLQVPPEREMDLERPALDVESGPFLDPDGFTGAVEQIGAEVYERRGVRNIVLVADVQTPPCDQGGEPLLGSYQVLPPDDLLRPDVTFEISVFYQSFKRQWEEDGPYDVEAEIEATIDHEVEHHLGHLAGRDVQDEEEVEQIKRNLVETYGRKVLAAGLLSDFMSDVSRFLKVFWPLLLLCAAGLALFLWLGR